MRLIDGDKLEKERWYLHRYVAGTYAARVEEMELKEVPTVDAASVKHGRWKAYSVPHWTKRYDDNGDPEYKNHNEYVCSICRRKTIVKEKFCPNCGAKMDLEEQDAKEKD